MITPPRRLVILAALAAVIGLAGGVAAYALVHLIALLTWGGASTATRSSTRPP